MPSVALLRQQVEAALAEVTTAEQSLESVLRDLHARPRAEKIRVSEVVEDAFNRLRVARTALATLREQFVEE